MACMTKLITFAQKNLSMNYKLIPFLSQERAQLPSLAPAKISTATRAAVNLFYHFSSHFML
jgi:hypothetical protein